MEDLLFHASYAEGEDVVGRCFAVRRFQRRDRLPRRHVLATLDTARFAAGRRVDCRRRFLLQPFHAGMDEYARDIRHRAQLPDDLLSDRLALSWNGCALSI